MGYGLKEDLNIPRIHTETGAMLMANPHTGLHIQFKLCECSNLRTTPIIIKRKQEKNAIMFIVTPTLSLTTELHPARRGRLPDAYLNSLQGKEYGQEFIRKNAHFLTDYFHYRVGRRTSISWKMENFQLSFNYQLS